MWQPPSRRVDPFLSLKSSGNTEYYWLNQLKRPLRFSGFRLTPLRTALVLLILGAVILSRDWHDRPSVRRVARVSLIKSKDTELPGAAFQPPEANDYRTPDSIDAFHSYKYRKICNISSLDLHAPFGPLCGDRASMLTAMSSGGRIGQDAPYMPRGCDMRWFTSEEVCDILTRFDRVVLVGDSMLRHVTGSINILLRKDIGYGAVTDWNFSMKERNECFCNEQFNVKACSVQGIYKTADVLENDPGSLSCASPFTLIMEEIQRAPIPDDEMNRFRISAASTSSKPRAFIFGHGLWSNLEMRKTKAWLDGLTDALERTGASSWYGLFVSPSAAGKQKPDEYLVTQGNKALMLYEEAVGIEVRESHIEHLGTWNMSIQSNKYDGVHLDMKGNLVKAMMVLNWLNLLET